MPLPIGSAVRIASATYLFAAAAASLTPSPSTTLLSSALENAHPVPWVDRLTICSPVSQNISPSAGTSRSSGGFRCPPVASTFSSQPISLSASAASGISSRRLTERPVSTPSSSRFGVTQSTRGSRLSRITATPSASSSSLPELDRSTGSSTTGTRPSSSRNAERNSATTATFSAVVSMPILIPAGGRSLTRQSSVALTTSAETAVVDRTPTVDCTVRPVIHEVPNRPCAANTIRSAVTPAPEDGSKPAIVSTVCICVTPDAAQETSCTRHPTSSLGLPEISTALEGPQGGPRSSPPLLHPGSHLPFSNSETAPR